MNHAPRRGYREIKASRTRIASARLGALYLFGSYARDDARDDSDVDLFVDPASDESFGFLDYMKAYEEIRNAVGPEVELGYSTRDGLSRYIRADIEKEAIRVF